MARPLLVAALPLMVITGFALALGIIIGRMSDSWELVFAPSNETAVAATTIYIADVSRGLMQPLRPRDSLEALAVPYTQGRGLALSPDRRYMIEDRRASTQQLILIDRYSGTAYAIGAGSRPVWSPDSRTIAYYNARRIFTVTLRNGVPGEPVMLGGPVFFDGDGIAGSGTYNWSPDSEWLAFDLIHTGGSDVYTVRRDGTDLTRLTTDLEVDAAQPIWSPDGRRIAFIAEGPGLGRAIYTIDRDGRDARLVVRAAGANYPAWSPDGNRIAYIGTSVGSSVLIVVAVDETPAPVALTPVSYTAPPIWSPDGRYLAYYDAMIHIIDIESRQSRRLTSAFSLLLP